MMQYLHVRTERLRLDALTSGDLDEVHKLHADPEVWRHLPSGRHDSREDTAAFSPGPKPTGPPRGSVTGPSARVTALAPSQPAEP